MIQLIGVVQGLAIEVRSNNAHAADPQNNSRMLATSRAKGDPAKIAQRNGWTFCTKKRLTDEDHKDILVDVIAVSLANRPGFVISDYLAEAIGPDGVLRAKQIAAEITG